MIEHRFHLAEYKTGVKTTCPHCGKPKCFTPYVDSEGRISFPETVGICDHINSCGYHYPPRQYFQDHPEMSDEASNDLPSIPSYPSTLQPTRKSEPPSYIDPLTMQQTLVHYEINPLYRFLCSRFGQRETARLFDLYKVGTSRHWNGSTIFWQIDKELNVRGGKVMDYNPKTGHRIKDEQAHVCWAHSLMHLPDFHLCQCLFGEHLLGRFQHSKVALVESEKTAIVASHYLPQYVWLATGGIAGRFKPEVMEALRGRDVCLFPDLKAFEKWKEQSSVLNPICNKVSVSDLLEKTATDEERELGLDLADYLLREETKEQILQKMIDHNPAIQSLIDAFDLELVEATAIKKHPSDK